MTRATVDCHGIDVEVNADREGIDLNDATVVDPVEAVTWIIEGATDEQLSSVAAAIVREQLARDEDAQRKADEREAQEHDHER